MAQKVAGYADWQAAEESSSVEAAMQPEEEIIGGLPLPFYSMSSHMHKPGFLGA